MRQKFQNDKYRKARGGYSRLINVSCEECKKHFLLYQKDGSGPLKRMYLDRIVEPETKRVGKVLKCDKCGTIIGTFYIYKKENRPAFRIYQNAIIKKIVGRV
jgi:ribosomal protein S27E